MTFGLGLFVCALSLWPTVALADTIEVRLDGYRLRFYENIGVTSTSLSQLDDAGTVSKYINKYVYDDNSLSGIIDPNYSYTDPTIDRVYDYSISLNDPNALGYEVYRTEVFTASSGAISNSFAGILIDLGSTMLSKDQLLRVALPSSGFQIETYASTTSSTLHNMRFSVQSVWTGTSVNNLTQATYTSGAFRVNVGTSFILIRLNSSGRSAEYLNGTHSYVMYGCPRIYLDVPSADALSINAQSVQNTTNINAQSIENTERMMDTTGSDTVAGGALEQYQDLHDNNQVVMDLHTMQETLTTAITDNSMRRVVAFPGISLMGFQIAAQDVAIPEDVLGLIGTIRFITTFCFICYFFRFLYCWVDAIWGLNDLQMPLHYEWIADEEDLSMHRKW